MVARRHGLLMILKSIFATLPLTTKPKLQVTLFTYLAIYNSTQKNKVYELPDGQTIILSSLLIDCPEALFEPLILLKHRPGIHEIC